MRGLYAIVDPQLCGGRDPLQVAADILRGGCAVLQLRDKRAEAFAPRAALARELAVMCREASVPFVVNDDVALARDVGAWGAHLGQDDMPLAEARLLAPGLQLGLSTHSLAQADEAMAAGADLMGFGPIYETASKKGADPRVGPAALARLCRRASVPVVAIGGITAARLPEVIGSGVPLVAAIGAICQADDVCAAARRFHDTVRDAAHPT